MKAHRRRASALVIALLLASGAGVAITAGDDREPVSGPARFDGRFVFARVRYADGYAGGGFAYRQDLPWAHDYPRAERNLMRILEMISFVDPYLGEDGGTILRDLRIKNMGNNAFYAQSGGVTSVINASAAGVIEAARKTKGRQKWRDSHNRFH